MAQIFFFFFFFDTYRKWKCLFELVHKILSVENFSHVKLFQIVLVFGPKLYGLVSLILTGCLMQKSTINNQQVLTQHKINQLTKQSILFYINYYKLIYNLITIFVPFRPFQNISHVS